MCFLNVLFTPFEFFILECPDIAHVAVREVEYALDIACCLAVVH